MQAAVLRAFAEPVVIEDLVLDPPARDEVRVRVAATAICGSDLHALTGSWGGALPVVYGHETSGVVTEVGSDVTSVVEGDHVVVSLLRTCGTCSYCHADQSHLCAGEFESRTRLRSKAGEPIAQGLNVAGFAEEVVVHHSQLVAVPRELPLSAASLLACGVLTGCGAVVNTAGVTPGSSVVVVGLGGVGINCVQAARIVGADPIVAVDTNPVRLAQAVEFGATRRCDPAGLIGGRAERFDYVFVAAGGPPAFEAGLAALRPGGTLVAVGMSADGEHARIDTSMFPSLGQRILGSKMGSARLDRDVPRLVEWYQEGRLHLDELISHRFGLADINEALAVAASGQGLRTVIEAGRLQP